MKKLIIANWKCNPASLTEAKKLFNGIKNGARNIKKTEIVICPPFIYLSSIQHLISNVQLGAQNCHYEQAGAFTGEVSPKMLKSMGSQYAIIGHSERREYFKETDETINKKLKAALRVSLKPILCIGEKKGQNPKQVISNQLKRNLKGLNKKDLGRIIIAYEPVWAIGTGDFCNPEKARKAKDFIKEKVNNKILYGGSVNSRIAKNYIKVGFDGLLVGGASLDVKEFVKILKNVQI